MSEARLLNMARRCKLLCGSLDSDIMACPCESPTNCHLSENERKHFETHDDIIERKKQNLILFKKENEQTI